MMRLRRLDLIRFGHFTDRSLDLGQATPGMADFHIIHGPNEAGKTTLMEAYLRLIYGFPMREPYGFKHSLPSLQVGGLVEIDGVATDLVRVKRAANTLLDRHGDPLPESILQACLGGIGQDDYRKLFCLDDATIEAGGEEITNSKGDFGRLLFAAAAGIGNLTGVLDQVTGRAEAFYKKSASKTAFAGLKHGLDAVVTEIRALDVTASIYRGLKGAVEAAMAAETAARQAKDRLERRKSQLGAVILAHPIAAELRVADADLGPIGHYPQTLDIDPEMLVALMTARVELKAARNQQAEMMAKAEADRVALLLRPDIITLKDEILALEELRGRMQGALADLPVREGEKAAALADMRAKLVELGVDASGDPTRFVLPEHQLRVLDQKLRDWRAAEALLVTATNEERTAALALADSTAQHTAAEDAVTVGPEVVDVLTRFGAAQCVEDNRLAHQRVQLAKATAAQSLRALVVGGVTLSALPLATVTLRQAEDLATDVFRARERVDSLRESHTVAGEKLAKAQARLGVLASATDLVTDDAAQATRSARDQRWTLHRAALDATTADTFATAMQRDDSATALRQAQTKDVADHQQARIAAGEAAVELQTAKDRLAEAVSAVEGLEARRIAHLAALHLPHTLSPADLAGWLRLHDLASRAQDDLHSVQNATESGCQSAEALRKALAALPGLGPDDNLDTLFRVASAQAITRQTQLADLQAKRDVRAKDAAALTTRKAARADAQTACEKAEALWQTVAATALPSGTAIANLDAALPGLRNLREVNETLSGLSRQITGMTRDRDVFTARITPLAKAIASPVDLSPLDTFRLAREALLAAETASDAFAKLTAAHATAEIAHDNAVKSIATQDAQIHQLAETFDPSIPTATLADLSSAVAQGYRAIALRAKIAALTTALTTRLAAPDRTTAEGALVPHPLADAEAELATLMDEEPRVTLSLLNAVGGRATAEAALNHVKGDAAVAQLVGRQRLIEVEMQDGALRYLEDRFAHLLAERAIRRYRDAHRGRMLVATEAAFRTLTKGAYAKLSTQPVGQSEALIATQTADGSTKQTKEMSKGTKFQLYLALRAAAYEQVASGDTVLPFFCDDIFETFDEGRTTAACGLMQQIGQCGQAIYLTHHRHVVDLARKLCGDNVKVHDLLG